MDNATVRAWYTAQIKGIPNQIDPAASLEDRARKAFDLRNLYRIQARELMSDVKARAQLDRERPNPGFEELVKKKMQRKSMTRAQALMDILETASKSNSGIDRELGL
ncbi:MAG: hypothetical protein LBS96_02240 [Oscillospiraceae bacterium]|nr:hypothetical protein [Oscillospiraceae bacterium]